MPTVFSSLSSESIDLGRAQQRLTALRWGMLGLCLLLLAAAAAVPVRLAWLPIGQALATLALINAVLPQLKRRGVAPLLSIRIGLLADVVALSEVLAFSGGAANPLASLYLPPVLFAALLSPGVFSWGLSALALAVYGALFVWHLPWPVADADAAYAFHAHQMGMWFTFALSALLMTGFISWLARQLADRERELAVARESQLRDEQLVGIGMQAAMAAHSLSTPLNTLTLLADEWAELQPAGLAADELALMQSQLRVCRDALARLKSNAQTGAVPVRLFSAITERLEGWRSLRPDVTLSWQPYDCQDPWVVLDAAFWPALFNLINNAAEAGGGQVGIGAHYQAGTLRVDIVNREGCLSDAQLHAAGLGQLQSGKPAGLGLGVMLSHATLARLGGSLTLDNRRAGGVHARITLPLRACPP
ncbi:MAG: HAMP domain-containing histidine kinase [Paludibacterium sp.]|uniref:ATP-binding protein n=1 Tax=Paludibacterium sp. TaxID=1917523 RepID=UPI0025FA78A8|nr:ATP-binding protein [Paludibacterium sp.]MBV8046079.1 HAMP domain-containing histidine kinase [Paludibacterium sp.]MBV8646168.1 HAMP domain-containing histidine kinase [Paludibacterium sp.]